MDDYLVVGPSHVMKDEGKIIAKEIKIEDVGELKEFIGCKIEIDKLEQSAKVAQHVMIQNLVQKQVALADQTQLQKGWNQVRFWKTSNSQELKK